MIKLIETLPEMDLVWLPNSFSAHFLPVNCFLLTTITIQQKSRRSKDFNRKFNEMWPKVGKMKNPAMELFFNNFLLKVEVRNILEDCAMAFWAQEAFGNFMIRRRQ